MWRGLCALMLFAACHPNNAVGGAGSPLEVVVSEPSGPFWRVVLKNSGAKTVTAYSLSARCRNSDNLNGMVMSRGDFAASLAFGEGGIQPGKTFERKLSLSCPPGGKAGAVLEVQVVVFDDGTWTSTDDRQLRFIGEHRREQAATYREWAEILGDPALEAKYQAGDENGLREMLSGRAKACAAAHRNEVPSLEEYLQTLLQQGVKGWDAYRGQLDAARNLHQNFERHALRPPAPAAR